MVQCGPAYIDRLPPEAHRVGPRRSVDMPATISGSAIKPLRVRASNISRRGCRLNVRCRFVIGTLMLITLPGLGPISARVAWSEEDRAGFQFVASLDAAVLDVLVARHPACPVDDRPRPLASWNG